MRRSQPEYSLSTGITANNQEFIFLTYLSGMWRLHFRTLYLRDTIGIYLSTSYHLPPIIDLTSHIFRTSHSPVQLGWGFSFDSSGKAPSDRHLAQPKRGSVRCHLPYLVATAMLVTKDENFKKIRLGLRGVRYNWSLVPNFRFFLVHCETSSVLSCFCFGKIWCFERLDFWEKSQYIVLRVVLLHISWKVRYSVLGE